MSDLFNNKHRISSCRLQNWNYANEGMYFVTIITKEREKYFGDIIDSVLQPTEIGKIAHSKWFKTIELRADMNLELGEFAVMPDNIHGIVIIGPNGYQTPITEYKNQFVPQSKNLSSIIRGYKSAVTTFAPVFTTILFVQRMNIIEFQNIFLTTLQNGDTEKWDSRDAMHCFSAFLNLFQIIMIRILVICKEISIFANLKKVASDISI